MQLLRLREKGIVTNWGGLLNFSPSGGGIIKEGDLLGTGAYLKFFDRQRQNYTVSMEFEMLRNFNNNYELLRYITNLWCYLQIENSYRCSQLTTWQEKTETNLHQVRGWKYWKQK